jgi:hypothetical protein
VAVPWPAAQGGGVHPHKHPHVVPEEAALPLLTITGARAARGSIRKRIRVGTGVRDAALPRKRNASTVSVRNNNPSNAAKHETPHLLGCSALLHQPTPRASPPLAPAPLPSLRRADYIPSSVPPSRRVAQPQRLPQPALPQLVHCCSATTTP